MSIDSTQSVYREQLIEHLLIGELLKYAWLRCGAELEVSQPAVDRAGHDLVLDANGVTRHVQLKSSFIDGATNSQTIHLGLAAKPSGCVVWVQFNKKTMELGPFLLFAGDPGQPLPDIASLKVAKHTKGDASGVKRERPNLRVVPKAKFRLVANIQDLYRALFGGARSLPANQEMEHTQ